MTKPRNKGKEFLFNLVFFLILPFLLLLKLCKKIKKVQDIKKEAKTQDKGEEDGDRKGPEVEIFKDGDILNDGRLRANSDLGSEHPDVRRGSKEMMSGIKRDSGTIGNEDNVANSETTHGSQQKLAALGSRGSSKEIVGETSTSSRGTDQDKVQVTTSSHSYTNITVDQKTEPSSPQVEN